MKFKDIVSIVEKVTYKPGWKISIHRPDYGNMIEIVFRTHPVPDAAGKRQGDGPILARLHFPPESIKEPNHLLKLIQDRVKSLELHEVDEWLKFENKWLKDPHPELVDRNYYSLYKWREEQ